jgi:hypothetical protein
MTNNGMAALIEAVRRRHLEAQGRAPEPPPAPEPAGAPDRHRIMRRPHRLPQTKRPALPEPGATLPEELRLQAQALGWNAEHLDRLASLLHASDKIGEVTAQQLRHVIAELIDSTRLAGPSWRPAAAGELVCARGLAATPEK